MITEKQKQLIEYMDVARYYCKMWIDGHGMLIIGEVIAWKPRPEPYRKEQER